MRAISTVPEGSYLSSLVPVALFAMFMVLTAQFVSPDTLGAITLIGLVSLVARSSIQARENAMEEVLHEPAPPIIVPARPRPRPATTHDVGPDESKTELSVHPWAASNKTRESAKLQPAPRPLGAVKPKPQADPIQVRSDERARLAREACIGGGAIDQLRRLKPVRFEHAVADIFRGFGFTVRVTPPVNDGGKDAIATRAGQTFLIECKRYGRDNRVGREDLQKFWAAMQDENATTGFFVTTGKFSGPALDWALSHNIVCLGPEWLSEAGLFWTGSQMNGTAACPTCRELVVARVPLICLGTCSCAAGHPIPSNALANLVDPSLWRATVGTPRIAHRKRRRRR